ncbi:hypothetical protein HZF24_17500 [Sedimentibacter hydroxybenzoicus DSM 7310]|uniref:Uncharacterized protein n=1 Tax=Sedimentibacter hydroxybenzoicus DSM 7310 TaxID=1123245 RepID=A0A974BN51_SEDHY|nr:hypothetical protein [Sedimentibacter hydroxybenzoicus]NYB75946.1 hypothetical protein [Sedimentibacter hydroxybenzoicus DSM 7310]
MDFKLYNTDIKDINIEEKINKKIKFDLLDQNKKYDLNVEFYNKDLTENMLSEDVSYEIKKEHYLFIKALRNIFEKNNIKVSKFNLMGSVEDLNENEMLISVLKTSDSKKENIIWPCKEIFIFEDHKNKLDTLLYSNIISENDYEYNLENLKEEFSIYDNEEEHRYLN